MNKQMKTREKMNQGITLIALVVTIIVLLILAGISIATLTGENGVLTKANTAREQTEIADTIERARVDILGVQAENKSGDITKKQFVEILGEYFDSVPTVEELPEDLATLTLMTKVEYGSHAIKISDIWNGKFGGVETPVPPSFENEFTLGSDASEAKNTNRYGWKVPEYTVKTQEFTTGVWRLFYQDNNYTYLITDECVGSYKPSDYYTTMNNEKGELKYQTGADVSTVGQKLNPIIGTLFTSSNTDENIRTTAWLTDTSDTGMWSSYKNTDAVFAIGSPTAELFAASYNNRSNKSNTITLVLGTYGYTPNTGSGWLSVSDNYGIYNKSTSSYWWLASPYSFSRYGELGVYGNRSYFYSFSVESISNAVRPIVCIPTSVFNNKYTLENE